MTLGQYYLHRIFKPRTIVIVGASDKTGTIGNATMANPVNGNFTGTLLPVNHKKTDIHGLRSVKDVLNNSVQ